MTDSFIASTTASTTASTDSSVDSSPDSSGAHRLTAQAIADGKTTTNGTQTLITTNEWARRRDSILTIVLWMLAVGMVFWLLSHVGRVILLLVISGLIAFALALSFEE